MTPIDESTNMPPEAGWVARHRTGLGVFVLLSVALALRLYGINWDQGGLFHPDERAFLSQVNALEFPKPSEYGSLLTRDSPLNPGSFNWGSLPHYMLKTVQYAASPFVDWDLFDLRIPGRVLSALADTVTVALVFLIGAKWFSRRVAFFGAGFAALAVLNIQLSHFFAVDALMTTFIVATVIFSVRVAHGGKRSDSILAGLMFGLGFATKFSVAPLVAPLIVGHLVYALSRPGDTLDLRDWRSPEAAQKQWQAFKGVVIAGLVALGAVMVTQPYMFFDLGTFFSNINEQSEMVRRIRDFPFTRQYIDTPRYWYQIWQLGFWGLGPALGLTVWLGLIAALVFTWFGRRKVDVVLLAWVVPYLLLTGWFDVKFLRYMVPLVPFLVLYGARLVALAGELLQAAWPRRKYLVLAPAAVVFIFTAHYALSFMSVYNGVHPANAATAWLAENAPPGSRVAQEHWEEGIRQAPGLEHVHERLELYNVDSAEKFDKITRTLESSDYLVLYSNRLYGTIPRVPERYPISARYYERLFDGSLGYELAFSDTRPVQSLGVTYYEDQFARIGFGPPANFEEPRGALLTIAPGWADESFSVYEHPTVLIFENSGRLSSAAMQEVIGLSRPATVRKVGLLLDADATSVQQRGGTWTEMAFFRDLPEGATWIIWLAAAEVLALLAVPVAFLVFRPFPDRGYLLAKPLGLLIAATFTWLLASVELFPFGLAGALLGALFLAVVSSIILESRWREIASFYRQRWKFILSAEALFLVAFLSFLAIRAANPDLWHPFRGGEKPMDFAYLNAVARSTTFPPYDPWFAGGYLNYYYFGQFLVAFMIRATGIIPSIAYNLAVPLLFAFTVGAAFSLVYSLAALTLEARDGVRRSLKARSPLLAGLGAAVLVAVAGNIDGLVQVAEGARRALFNNVPAGAFDFWRSSRMFGNPPAGNEITEFPFFTFLFADLHAHLIAIPFAILALAIAVSVFVGAGKPAKRVEVWGRLAMLGVVIGALRIINAWDFPTQLLIAGMAVVTAELIGSRGPLASRAGAGLLKWVFVAVIGYVVYLPFHQNFELFNNGVLQSETQTPVWRYFVIHSIFLAAVISWLFFELRERLPELRTQLADYMRRNAVPVWVAVFISVALAATVLTFAFSVWGTLIFTVLLALATLSAGVLAYRANRLSGRLLLVPVAFVIVALALGGGVDVFTVKDDIGRMNTVFKFYLQAWWLYALASAYFLWLLGVRGKFSLRRLTVARGVWMTAIAVVAAGVMVYPVLGTQVRIRDRFSTEETGLDGAAFMAGTVHFERDSQGETVPIELDYDLRAIEWLQRNVDGSPVIVEGLTDLYRWGGRVSIYTGLPAVIGWDWHQRQQRVNYAFAVTERRREVDAFYSNRSLTQALALMDKYNVRYVYVGELERLTYPASGLDKFNLMGALGLTPVYEDGPVTIYRYEPLRSAAR